MLRRTDLPEDRTFLRLDLSHEYIPAPAGRIGSSVHLRDPESDPCIEFPVLRPTEAKSRAGDLPDSAPDGVAGLHDLLYKCSSDRRSLLRDDSRICILRKCSPLFKAKDDHRDRSQDLGGRKTADDTGNSLFLKFTVNFHPRDRAHVTRIEKCVRTSAQRPIGFVHGLVGCQQSEVLQSALFRLFHGEAGRGDRRLKADGQKNDLSFRILLRERDRVKRRIDDLHGTSPRPHAGKIHLRSRYTDEISEGRDHRLFFKGQTDRLVYEPRLRHADRTSGA